MTEDERYEFLLDGMCQRRLDDMQYLVHKFEGSINFLLSLVLNFDHDQKIEISTAGDGESLIVGVEVDKQMDLGEYGVTEIVSEYPLIDANKFVRRKLTKYNIGTGPTDKPNVIELHFGNSVLEIKNHDDSLSIRSLR